MATTKIQLSFALTMITAFACHPGSLAPEGQDNPLRSGSSSGSSGSSGGNRGGATTGNGEAEDEDQDGDGNPDDGPPSSSSAPPAGCAAAEASGDLSSASALKERVTFFASKENGGRVPGTPGDMAVRKHVEDFFKCLGLETFQQTFTNSNQASTANVVGVLRGTDPTVGKEMIIIAAHHDHFGTLGNEGLRLGANDNASGLAGLLASARALKKRGAHRRTLVFIAFGAEETLEAPPWDEGSHFFVTHLPTGFSLDNIVHVTTMDMIGTYRDTTNVDAMGTPNGTPGRTALQEARTQFPNIKITFDADAEEGDSDFDPFCRRGVPYVGFYTEDSSCYHKACDTADRLDYENMSSIVKIATEMNAKLASTPTNLIDAKKRVSDPCRFK